MIDQKQRTCAQSCRRPRAGAICVVCAGVGHNAVFVVSAPSLPFQLYRALTLRAPDVQWRSRSSRCLGTSSESMLRTMACQLFQHVWTTPGVSRAQPARLIASRQRSARSFAANPSHVKVTASGSDEKPRGREPAQTRQWDVETLLVKYQKGFINLNPEYQRGYVWDQKRASKLIESVFMVSTSVTYDDSRVCHSHWRCCRRASTFQPSSYTRRCPECVSIFTTGRTGSPCVMSCAPAGRQRL